MCLVVPEVVDFNESYMVNGKCWLLAWHGERVRITNPLKYSQHRTHHPDREVFLSCSIDMLGLSHSSRNA